MSGKQGAGNKIVLVGDSGVGKTCLISRFITGNFDANVNTTNGASYASKTVEFPQFKKSLVLDIWDTAGQEKYRSLTKFFYKDALMVIMVYDITRRESYDNVKNYWYKEIQENGEKNVVFGIAGNKSDLYEEEAVPEKEAREFAQSVNAIFALHDDSIYVYDEDDKQEIQVLKVEHVVQVLLQNMIRCFESLEKQYPNNIKLDKEEE